MLNNCRTLVIVFLGLGCFQGQGQKLYLSWKRAFHPQDFLYATHYDLHPFQLLDFFVERPLSNPRLSLGLEVVYADYHTPWGGNYQKLGGKGDFYERSFSTGLIGRWYTEPRVWRFYLEAGIHGNFLHTRQPAVINYYYGTYERIIDENQFVISGTLALGFSLGNKRIRYEPYVQYGLVGNIEVGKTREYLTGSVGKVKTNHGLLVCPLAIKVMLF